MVGKLTVGTIADLNIKCPAAAYLSAYCTAETTLADEPIHTVGGSQLAGFSLVLGTLWEQNNLSSQQVAGNFCGLLFDTSNANQERAIEQSTLPSCCKETTGVKPAATH